MKTFLLAAGVLALALRGATIPPTPTHLDPPRRAAPRIIIVHGGVMSAPRYLTDWYENLDLMQAMNQNSGKVAELSLAGRRYVELSLLWYGPTWEPFAKDTTLLKTLDPADPRAQRGCVPQAVEIRSGDPAGLPDYAA